MQLCKLTAGWNNEPVWVNPANVVSFYSDTQGTVIITNGSGRDGAYTVTVIEEAWHVAQMMDDAMS